MQAINLLMRIGVGILLLALAACVVEEVPSGSIRPLPPPGRPQFCPRLYAPVCAVRGRRQQTFPNACEADAAGFRAFVSGRCADVGPGPGPGPGPAICTREYRPVCARRGGFVRTFGNPCEAESAGFRIVYPGQCNGGGGDFGGGPGFGGGPSFGPGPDMAQVGSCPNIYRPVCTQLGALPRTFPNACEAERRGYPIIGPGPC